MFLKEAWGQVQELGLQGEVDGMFSYEEEVVSEQFNVSKCGLSAGVDLLIFDAAQVQEYSWYRGTSLISKRLLLGPCSRPLPSALRWSSGGGGRFLEARSPCRERQSISLGSVPHMGTSLTRPPQGPSRLGRGISWNFSFLG